MKQYIILGNMPRIGGGQLYTANKVEYLKKNGWLVQVYTPYVGEEII